MAGNLGKDIDEDLKLLDAKLKQCKVEYEQYFMGHRPREPVLTRGEIQKIVALWSNLPIKNTAMRFRFNNLCARFFTFRRQWSEICRKIEEGSYEPHLKRAQRRVAVRQETAPRKADILQAYLDARAACGQSNEGLDRAKVEAQLAKQRAAIQKKYGCADVHFRVVVEDGRAKFKATPIKA